MIIMIWLNELATPKLLHSEKKEEKRLNEI